MVIIWQLKSRRLLFYLEKKISLQYYMTYNYECFCNVSMLCYAILIIRFAIECIAMCKDKMQAVLIFQTMLSA